MRFLKATIEGNYLALSDEKRAKDMLAKEVRITDPRIIDTSYNDFKQQSPHQPQAVAAGSARTSSMQFPGLGAARSTITSTPRMLDDLKNEGFFAAMEQQIRKALARSDGSPAGAHGG